MAGNQNESRLVLPDLRFVPLKAGLAAGVALILDVLLGNPDHVSSTFVSVLCVAPTVRLGIRSALEQLGGSLIGGLFGALALWVALVWAFSPLFTIPPAVTAAILALLILRRPEGVAVAAFTALYLPAVPRGTALDTLVVRILAIGIGAGAGFLTNSAISWLQYPRIFSRRLRIARTGVLAGCRRLALTGDPNNLRGSLGLLDTVHEELESAISEPGWGSSARTGAYLRLLMGDLERLRRIAHLMYEAALLARASDLEPGSLLPLVRDVELAVAADPPSGQEGGSHQVEGRAKVAKPLAGIASRLKRELPEFAQRAVAGRGGKGPTKGE